MLLSTMAMFLCVSCDSLVNQQMNNIENKVASDAVEQYNIAKRNGGTAIDICVQAGMVAQRICRRPTRQIIRLGRPQRKVIALLLG
jgi:serine protease inhibitor